MGRSTPAGYSAQMTFKVMAYVTMIAASVLGLRFLVAGASVMKDWGLDGEAPVVIGRRIGALYLGLALMFFLGRGAGPSELRSAVCVGMSAAMLLLAGLGVFERWAGHVSSGIVAPAIIEAIFSAGFAWAWWNGR